MLIEFSVKNYLCFKDKVTLSMVASPDKEHEDHTFSVDNFNEKLLKSIVIYGANASGKSNLFKAMNFMRTFVISSSKDRQVGEKTGTIPFKLSTVTDKEPSEFEVSFISKGTRYRYGFLIDKEKVHKEWLYYVPSKREAKLFERTGDKFNLSGVFKEGKGLQDKTRNNALFLSVAAQFNGEISTGIIKWFYDFRVASGLNRIPPLSMKMMQSKYSGLINHFMKNADLNIEKISIQEQSLALSEFDNRMITSLRKRTPLIEDIKITNTMLELMFHHKKYNKQNEPVSTEKFTHNEESNGTAKLFKLAGPIIKTIFRNNVLVIDELDTSLHFLIILYILKLFHSSGNQAAQLIFNCHNPRLLSNKIFRRDQIYFVEKDFYGASDLYSLYDFNEGDGKVRKDASFDKDYLVGKYGAVPKTGNVEELLFSLREVEYGEK